MHVLQVMECTIGGTRRHLADLVLGLRRRGVKVDVVCSTLRDPRMHEDLEAFRAAGAGVHVLPMTRAIRPLRDAWHTARLAALLLPRRIDVVHTHSSKAGALGRVAALACSDAVRVHTPHTFAFSFAGGAGQGGQPAGPPGLLLATERLLGRITRRMIHVSESERLQGQQLRVIAPARAVVIPNGIEVERHGRPGNGAALRAELGLPSSARVLGSVGLLNDAKGHDLLVAALARLPADVHVLLVGHGERESALRAQAAQLGLTGRVHFAGWRDDLAAVHAALDIFVLPSRWEGLPYALLEALAAGKPSVATEVNGSRDVLGCVPPAGLLVPREDPVALADALAALLADPALATRLATAGRRRVAEEFGLEVMLDRTVNLYRELLGGRRSRA